MKCTIRRIATAVLCIYLLAGSVFAKELVPVGKVIGLELRDQQVVIAGFDEEQGQSAKQAGLCEGDVIEKIDDVSIQCVDDIRKALEQSRGKVEVEIRRNGKASTLSVMPRNTQNGPRLGVYLRQGVSGIGTVTFYDPESHTFGTLGHGVNDNSGHLLTMVEGQAYHAQVLTVKKGKCGSPGQLIGTITSQKPAGVLYANTSRGVFGTCEEVWAGERVPVATAKEIKTGDAVIRSTISGDTPREYSVKIIKLYPENRANGRNMLVKVTDPALLATTGGIVQGMSGSPILQNGKLIGAVTHVLVNDPTTGYGIFIENMLDAAA